MRQSQGFLSAGPFLWWAGLFLFGCSTVDTTESPVQKIALSAEAGSWEPDASGLPPKLLKAFVYETKENTLYLRATLSGRLALETTVGVSGFRLDGAPGVRLVDAIAFTNRRNPSDRRANLTSDVLLAWDGPLEKGASVQLFHERLGTVAADLSLLPAPVPALPPEVRARLPRPILPDHQDWIELYYAAWTFMHAKITFGDRAKGFEERYIDEGFNQYIYQWDSSFMAMYALYGLSDFPAMAALDNFYNHQRSDGYICRCYSEATGLATGEADINPPLFAWAEWKYLSVTGDKSRLSRVLPVLDRYFNWIKGHSRAPAGNGLYFITNFGSGMDNSPREEFLGKGAWIDLSAQQALAAQFLARLAEAAGDAALAETYRAEYAEIKGRIQQYLWNDDLGIYLDRREDGGWHERLTIASFWPLLAGLPTDEQARTLIAGHLKNPREFAPPYLFPTLAASDPDFDPTGHYWRGGVWAPTNYMVIKGLEAYDPEFAFEAALRHIAQMSTVYQRFDPSAFAHKMPLLTDRNIARNGDGRREIWEAYSPTQAAPETRWDGELLVRQKFCGWSGLGPIALLIENVLGLEIKGIENTLVYRPRLLEEHGLEGFMVAGTRVDLRSQGRQEGDPLLISGRASGPLILVIKNAADQEVLRRTLEAGEFRFTVPMSAAPEGR